MSSENDWIDAPEIEEQWGPWIYHDPKKGEPPTYKADAVQVEFYNEEPSQIRDAEEWVWGGVGDYCIKNYRVRHVGPWIAVPDDQMECPCDENHYVEVKLLDGHLNPNMARADWYSWDLSPERTARILKFRHVSKEDYDKRSV